MGLIDVQPLFWRWRAPAAVVYVGHNFVYFLSENFKQKVWWSGTKTFNFTSH
jgi:hypothetical protein